MIAMPSHICIVSSINLYFGPQLYVVLPPMWSCLTDGLAQCIAIYRPWWLNEISDSHGSGFQAINAISDYIIAKLYWQKPVGRFWDPNDTHISCYLRSLLWKYASDDIDVYWPHVLQFHLVWMLPCPECDSRSTLLYTYLHQLNYLVHYHILHFKQRSHGQWCGNISLTPMYYF